MAVEFDAGPPPAFANHFAAMPSYASVKNACWFDWGPVFYRGRLDGSQRVLCVAQDPGPTERIAGRTLVGNAGQRVQGFLAKIGLTRSYLCLNTYLFGMHKMATAKTLLTKPAHKAWRNALFDMAKTPSVQAIIAFGKHAQDAVSLWPGKGAIPVIEVQHPTARNEGNLLAEWKPAVIQLRGIVTPDADGSVTGANDGQAFKKSDYRAIPRRDLPFGAPDFLGDDAWARDRNPPLNGSVYRPKPDDGHTLTWLAPK
jgi:hypothetical protein